MQAEKSAGKVYEFEMKTIDGKTRKLSAYKGHPLLIVNTASLCGFTPQYKDLEALYEKFKNKGLSIAAFPANEFGAQEPGCDADIKKFCMTKYSISFDLYSKISVKGEAIHPLYKHLTVESGFPGEIPWNFSKFLVNKNGKVVARFAPDANPVGTQIVAAVEDALADESAVEQ
ncbi:MAG TPA: glutathione peroxidase [Elusimicrobia bacterium]|nr:MAG: glutathione peroxidase [Elusimicrobia bacterium GWA2_66_18]OGR73678.1 MAG: glutathione peroxidase [Elusimicrobia bacterium GWC2_65_9]HAZ07711.1 glutathione peroxidase [Elusimicrobiota bacterium]